MKQKKEGREREFMHETKKLLARKPYVGLRTATYTILFLIVAIALSRILVMRHFSF